MDRRFICVDCSTKWFLPAEMADREDLTSCDNCGGDLVRFDGGDETGPAWGGGAAADG